MENEPKFEQESQIQQASKSPDAKEPTLEKETTPEQEEAMLKTAEIEESRPISEKGINETQYVLFKGGGAGIFKPRLGEKQVPKMEKIFAVGTYYKRERAAYLVDKALGFGIVPPTEIRTINGQEGSIQKFVENAAAFNSLPPEQRKNPELQNELIKAWVFDYIISQSDIGDENFLVEDGRVVAIDNGLSFEKSETDFNYKDFWKQPLPAEVGDKIKRFFTDEKGIKSLKDSLSDLLSSKEVSACLKRAERVREFVEKEAIWSRKEQEVKKIPHLEAGTQKIITALNLSEIPTSQSCEGHLHKNETGINLPFIEISAPNQPERRFIGQEKIIPKVAKKYGMKPEDIRTMLLHSMPHEEFQNSKETQNYKEWRKENNKIAKRAEKLLKDFYQDSATPEHVHLTVKEQNAGQFEISNVGREQDRPSVGEEKNLTPEQKTELNEQLTQYQREIDNFAGFIKEKYFRQSKTKKKNK